MWGFFQENHDFLLACLSFSYGTCLVAHHSAKVCKATKKHDCSMDASALMGLGASPVCFSVEPEHLRTVNGNCELQFSILHWKMCYIHHLILIGSDLGELIYH